MVLHSLHNNTESMQSQVAAATDQGIIAWATRTNVDDANVRIVSQRILLVVAVMVGSVRCDGRMGIAG